MWMVDSSAVRTRTFSLRFGWALIAASCALGGAAHAQPVQPEPAPAPAPPPAEPPVQLSTEPPPARVVQEPREEQLGQADEGGTEAAQQPISAQETAKQASEMPKTGWVTGKGFIVAASEDEDYKLRIGLQSGTKAELIYLDGDAQDRRPFFTIRPIMTGNVVKPWIQFWTSMELARNPPYLLDSYVDIVPIKEAGLRVGQQFTPFSRHEYYGPQQLLFPEFAPVAEYFWSGRDKGITALGALGENSVIEYWAGFYGGSPLRQFTTIAGNYVLEARVTINPMGPAGATEYPYIVGKDGEPAPFRVSFNLNGWYGKIQSATENFNESTFQFVAMPSGMTTKNGTLGVDTFIQASRFVFFVEAYWRDTAAMNGVPSYRSLGAWGQAGYMLVTNKLDIAARVNWLNPSTGLDHDQFKSIEGEFNWYISAPVLVLKLRYGYGNQQTPSMDELGPVRLAIAPGKLHLLTLQLNLAF